MLFVKSIKTRIALQRYPRYHALLGFLYRQRAEGSKVFGRSGFAIVQLYLILVSCCLFGCSKDQYIYDKTGFEPGSRPQDYDKQSTPVQAVPDYYYRQPTYPQQNYVPQGQGSYGYPYQYQQPYYQPYYQQQVAPGSRFYSNPYAIPPSTYYPNYDVDQYYVPPSYYRNNEPSSQQNPAAAKY